MILSNFSQWEAKTTQTSEMFLKFNVEKLYSMVLMFLFTCVAVVSLLVSAIVAAVFSPTGKRDQHPLKYPSKEECLNTEDDE